MARVSWIVASAVLLIGGLMHVQWIFFTKDIDSEDAGLIKRVSTTIQMDKNRHLWNLWIGFHAMFVFKKETRNVRLAYDQCSGKNVHHCYVMIFRHTDNHLKQIRKVKSHPAYPK